MGGSRPSLSFLPHRAPLQILLRGRFLGPEAGRPPPAHPRKRPTPAMSQWYYAIDRESHGPVSGEELRERALRGELGRDDLVWTEGLESWQPAHHFLTFPSEAPAHAAMPEGQPRAVRYAGFWLRAVAVLLDGIIFFIGALVVTFVLSLVAGGLLDPDTTALWLLYAFSFLGNWLFYAGFEASAYRATPGKRLLGLAVTDLQGRRLTFARATGRHFGKILSGLIFYIGYLMAGFTKRKQALHDMLAGCLVVQQ